MNRWTMFAIFSAVMLTMAACGGEGAAERAPTPLPTDVSALEAEATVEPIVADAATVPPLAPTDTPVPSVILAPTATVEEPPAPSPTSSPIPVPTPIPTATVAVVPTPTLAPVAVPIPTLVPTPTPTPAPSTLPSLPDSASPGLQACLAEVISQELLTRLAEGESPSIPELMTMAPCLLALGDSEEPDDTDEATATAVSAIVEGQLTSVQLPTAVSIPADNSGCQEFEGNVCAELRWELLSGIQSGEATRIRIAPSDPNVIYAVFDANDMSAWKSTDAGVTWQRISHNAHTSDLVVHPTNPDIALYSVLENNVYGTVDGGRSWQAVLTAAAGVERGAAQFNALAQSSSSPGVVYAAVGGEERGTFGGSGTSKIFSSSDSWQHLGASLARVGTGCSIFSNRGFQRPDCGVRRHHLRNIQERRLRPILDR